ncbi:MAG: ribosome silencing factor, partial [Aquiluna sp.]|nr:ribosome silencing factor [Aquiluna sp.]
LQLAADAAREKLGEDLVALDVSEPFALAEIFLIVSAKNERQAQAIAEEVEDQLAKQKVKARFREGRETGRWILLDFGDLVVHVMHEQEREFYSLERLWRDCPVVPTA